MASTLSLMPNIVNPSLVTLADVDHLINLEEDNIKNTQNRILQLRTQRNMLTTICRIPQELLGEILVALANSYVGKYHIFYGSKCSAVWTSVTAVCRYWRHVCLHTPRMWACIPLNVYDKSNLLSVFTARSGHAPLTLIQPIRDRPFALHVPQLKIIFSEFRRTQELSLMLNDNALDLFEQTLGGLDAPHLRTLIFGFHSTRFPPSQTSFPTIANASWPKLSSLQCNESPFALVQALTRPSLTRLIVGHLPTPQPAITWVNLLGKFPCLEELTIIAGIADPGTPAKANSQPTQTVALQRLKYLYLRDSKSGVASADFLSYLTFPTDARLVFMTSSKDTDEELQFVLSACIAKTQGWGTHGGALKPIRTLTIGPGRNSPTLSLFTEDIPIGEQIKNNRDVNRVDGVAGTPAQCLSLFGRYSEQKEHIIRLFLSTYPLQHVHGVHIDRVELQEAKTWQAISALPSMREMYITRAEKSVRPFLEVFSQSVSFANLETLIFATVTWNRDHKKLRKRRAREGSLLLDLVRSVDARSKQGQVLKQLELIDSVNTGRRYRCSEDLQRLAKLVETFKHGCVDPSDFYHEQCWSCSEDSGDEVDSMAEDVDEARGGGRGRGRR